MSISTRFSVGVHLLTLIHMNQGECNSSRELAQSINTNPVVVRKIIGLLKKASLVTAQAGVAGVKLAREASDLSLLDVYRAVDLNEQMELFHIHENPNPDCIVGRNIQSSIEPVFLSAQQAMENQLAAKTIADMVAEVLLQEKNQTAR